MAQPQYFHWLPMVIHDLHLKLFNSDRFSPSQLLKEHFTQIMMLSHTQTIQLENKIKARREQKSRDHVHPDPNELSLQIIHCGIKLLMMFQTLYPTHTHTHSAGGAPAYSSVFISFLHHGNQNLARQELASHGMIFKFNATIIVKHK